MPVPTDPQDRFNHFANEFVGSCEGIEKYCDDLLQQARHQLAYAEGSGSTPEQRAELCLRQVQKPILRLMHAMDEMYASLGMAKPFAALTTRPLKDD